MTPITVVICDDQPLIRSSLQLILETDPQIRVLGTAADGAEALELVERLDPSVVLMDIQMPRLDGIAATARLTAQSPRKIIVLTTFDRDDYLFEALDAGASGFLLKNTDPETLIAAVHQVAAGYGLLSPEVTLPLIRRHVAEQSTRPRAEQQRLLDGFSERELQVLQELATGKNNQEIAVALGLSEPTVKTHLSNLMAKAGLRDRVQAVLYAHRAGLIQ
ncbi:response regulator [Glutamicibacter endophyticus]|uniref:response regulator n=1 Tax=Glutamicibacter endophyticus TaxID=1522174 RepID=UPI003AF08240